VITREQLTDSVLLINKPSGITSFDVIGKVRKILDQRKIGHAGTLDKAASGLLVVCAGKATRLSPYFLERDKCYRGVIQLGAETETCDEEGEIIRRVDPSFVTDSMIHAALERFKGGIMQRPPVYSALKFGGKRASDLARAGKDVEIEERMIVVSSCDLVEFDRIGMTITIDVNCSKGTYIRSIARDIGEILGCCGYLKKLIRTSSGFFSLDESVTPDELAGCVEGRAQTVRKFWRTPLESVSDMGLMTVNADGYARIINGAQFPKEMVVEMERRGNRFAVSDGDKNLIAIVDIDSDNWQIEYRNVFIR
jgi:tRNA pseudouridine55 synthase